MAGSAYSSEGAAVDPLSLLPDPLYLLAQSGYQNCTPTYGVEYETHHTPLDHSANYNIPCTLRQAYGHTNKIMFPSNYECPSGWRRKHYGYLMLVYYAHKAATQFTCIDGYSLQLLTPLHIWTYVYYR